MDAPVPFSHCEQIDDDAFMAAQKLFGELVSYLKGDTSSELEHSELESSISKAGTEIMRQLLQGHLDSRATKERVEPKLSAVGDDGINRTHRRNSQRKLLSIFGQVTIHRIALSMRGVSGSLMCMDAQLNLPHGLYSFGVRRRIVEEIATGSFDQAVENVRNTTGAHVAKRQAVEAVRDAMVDFDAFYVEAPVEEVAPEDYLILTFDGKGVVMRKEGLRPATRKAAEKSKNKLKTRLSAGEKRGRKRMAEVAAVYEVSPWPRTTDQVFKSPGCGPIAPRPRPKNKRVWASLVDNTQTVINGTFDEAVHRDPHHAQTWVVLVDGNEDQIRYAGQAAERLRKPITMVLDIVHAIEYLWKAAWNFYEKGDPAVEEWVGERIRRLLDGKVSGVAAEIRRCATVRGLEEDDRTAVDSCANYFLKYKNMMRYHDYLAAGMPIGTGVIEGACRYLVKDRMDITGARWGLEGAEAVLKARSLRSSGDLEEYLDFHRHQELKRNHLAQYENNEISGVAIAS